MSYTKERLENVFVYHAPFGTQVQRYQTIRDTAKTLAETILESCPQSPETTIAINKIREAVMMANAAIECNEGEFDATDPNTQTSP